MTDEEGDPAAARERVVEAFERSAEVYGLRRSYGRLYGELFFATEPLSLDELAERTGYAKSTTSTVMKDLERLYMVHRRSKPGEGKRAYFEAERDFWYVVQELLQNEVRREIDVMQRALAEAEADLEAAEGERAELDRERVAELRQVYDRADRLVDLYASLPVEQVAGLLDRLDRDD